MRRTWVSLVIASALLCMMTAPAFASKGAKEANVALYVNGLEDVTEITVDQGDVIDLAAVTLKQGSSMTDSWNGVTESEQTVLNTDNGYYEAAATLDTAGLSGSFEVEYRIVMAAGKSHVTFEGGKKANVVVVESAVTVRKIIINIKSVEEHRNFDKNELYVVKADGQAELSDGEVVDISGFEFTYKEKHDSETIEVSIDLNGDGVADQVFELEVDTPLEPGDEVIFNDPVPLDD